MKKSYIVIGVIIVIVIGIFMWFKGSYNQMVTRSENVSSQWSNVENQYQRRLDLIPNLVETVKGYASHERGTLEEVTQARTAVMNAPTPEGKMQADGILTGALKNLFAVAEAYPDLKANANFQQLQAELSNTEDKISYMRQSYNDTVMKFNTAIQTFPAVLLAGMMGFKQRDSFDATAGAEVAPKVQF